MPEYSVPIMFDVTAPDRETAGRVLVEILAKYQLPGCRLRTEAQGDVVGTIESWWTIEGQDKHLDRNDNDPGEVVFGHRHSRVYLNPNDASNPFIHRVDEEPF